MKKIIKLTIVVIAICLFILCLNLFHMHNLFIGSNYEYMWIEKLGENIVVLDKEETDEFRNILCLEEWKPNINTKKNYPIVFFGFGDEHIFGIIDSNNNITYNNKYFTVPDKIYSSIIEYVDTKLNK